ncbi:transposase [Amycolatopsis orientalis]|uniref:transposase n=1 Tax=Amycolatopsis orientalis TaxID=31958 RepID=UPI000566F69B|nr:transposase [Amycolatopsis orientalis]
MSRRFSEEFRDQVVDLFRRGGRTFTEIGAEFDLSPTTVANWVRKAANDEGKLLPEVAEATDDSYAPKSSDKAEIVKLKRKLKEKEEELEILGKALAFFARRKDQ